MARVCLTESQRQQKRLDAKNKALVDGLLFFKASNRLSNQQMADGLNINVKTFSHLVNDHGAKITLDTFWNILETAGLEVSIKQKGGI